MFKAYLNEENTPYAWKRQRKASNKMSREIEILEMLKGVPNIIQLKVLSFLFKRNHFSHKTCERII